MEAGIRLNNSDAEPTPPRTQSSWHPKIIANQARFGKSPKLWILHEVCDVFARTRNPCMEVCLPHEGKTNTATQYTTLSQHLFGLDGNSKTATQDTVHFAIVSNAD